jgi:hypothetical protein
MAYVCERIPLLINKIRKEYMLLEIATTNQMYCTQGTEAILYIHHLAIFKYSIQVPVLSFPIGISLKTFCANIPFMGWPLDVSRATILP